MNEVYLANYLCYYSYEFKKEFGEYFHFKESRNGELWQVANRFPPLINPIGLAFYNTVWVHVWDDSPYSAGPRFELCLKNCNPKKNFFICYETANPDFLDKLVENRFSACYPQIDERNDHFFLINPKTNAGIDRLVEAVRKAQLC